MLVEFRFGRVCRLKSRDVGDHKHLAFTTGSLDQRHQERVIATPVDDHQVSFGDRRCIAGRGLVLLWISAGIVDYRRDPDQVPPDHFGDIAIHMVDATTGMPESASLEGVPAAPLQAASATPEANTTSDFK